MTAPADEDSTASDREIVLTRVVDAPRALVWKVWTDSAHVPQWWGPTGFTTTTQEMDLRPGGRWRFVMRGPDGREYPNLITYQEIVEGTRLVFESSFSDAAGAIVRAPFSTLWPLRTLSTVTFEQHAGKGGGTVVTVRGIPLDASEAERRTFDEGHASMRQGWAGTFEQLAGHVAML
jgi:uncharacterized protein YndB with AHSA1/START domain